MTVSWSEHVARVAVMLMATSLVLFFLGLGIVWALTRAWTWCLLFGFGLIAAEVVYFLATGPR